MKALLILAPCWVVNSPPYNIAYLKSTAEKEGHNVQCIDFNVRFFHYITKKNDSTIYNNPTSWYWNSYVESIILRYSELIDSWITDILSRDAEVIGFSATGITRFFSLEMARRIKKRDPRKRIVFGGPLCFKNSLGTDLIYQNSFIDCICLMEGDELFPAMLNSLEKNGDFQEISGICFRDKNGNITNCGERPFLENLDNLPYADFSDFDLSQYTESRLPISTSRGCINRCTYCTEAKVWKKYRHRNAGEIAGEMLYQKKMHPGIELFFFNDSLINGNISVLEEVCDILIAHGSPLFWGGQACIRKEMTESLIRKLKKAGLLFVSFGVEHISPAMLKLIGKRYTPELVRRIIMNMKQAGIRTDVNILVGLPGETEEDVLYSINFLSKNKRYIDAINFHPLAIDKGSYLYENKERWGIVFNREYNTDTWNPNNWFSAMETNTLETRLELLDFYQNYIGRTGFTFFSMAEYYSFAADGFMLEGHIKKAIAYYEKALEKNMDPLKAQNIKEKIAAAGE